MLQRIIGSLASLFIPLAVLWGICYLAAFLGNTAAAAGAFTFSILGFLVVGGITYVLTKDPKKVIAAFVVLALVGIVGWLGGGVFGSLAWFFGLAFTKIGILVVSAAAVIPVLMGKPPLFSAKFNFKVQNA